VIITPKKNGLGGPQGKPMRKDNSVYALIWFSLTPVKMKIEE